MAINLYEEDDATQRARIQKLEQKLSRILDCQGDFRDDHELDANEISEPLTAGDVRDLWEICSRYLDYGPSLSGSERRKAAGGKR